MSVAPVTELPRHVIDLLLQYLLPPTPPLPSHLLSNALRQRHHFLEITSASNPSEYLLWPRSPPGTTDIRSEQNAIIIELDQLASRVDVAQSAENYEAPFEYEMVQDVLQGRFLLPGSDLQLVCVFEIAVPLPGVDIPSKDAQPEWRYHDIIRKSTPPKGFVAPDEALAAAEGLRDHSEDVDDTGVHRSAADFWEGWGSSPDGTPEGGKSKLPPTKDQEDKEDLEYFERHETVQHVVGEMFIPNDPSLVSPSRAMDSSASTLEDPSNANFKPNGRTLDLNRHGPLESSHSLKDSATQQYDTIFNRRDDAVIKIVQGAYTLWESSEGNPSATANEKAKKLAFLSLVEKALSL